MANELWQGYQRRWATRLRALQMIADDAGHCVHVDAPTLVASVIDAVVQVVRAGASYRSEDNGNVHVTVGVGVEDELVAGRPGRVIVRLLKTEGSPLLLCAFLTE